jgi:hypothetical protein
MKNLQTAFISCGQAAQIRESGLPGVEHAGTIRSIEM